MSATKGPIIKVFTVNFKYRGPNNTARSGALILDAADVAEAKKQAERQIANQHPWFKITTIREEKNDSPQLSI